MSRLSIMDPTEATGVLADTFASMKRAAGRIPNAYLTAGTHNPAGLLAVLQLDEAVAKSQISETDLEIVRLLVSYSSGCDYCVAAHKQKARFLGLPSEIIQKICSGRPTGDVRRDALISLVRSLTDHTGKLSSKSVEAIIDAGYSESQLVGIALAISSTTFLNVLNRINDTAIDFLI